MALTRWERFGLDRPERLRRWFEEPDGWLRVEEIHEEGTLVVRAELPGIDPDKDLDVSVSDEILHISAKREEKSEHKGRQGYRSEFRYGEFSRNLALPSGIDANAIKASYKGGILEVRIPWPGEPEMPTTKVSISRS